MVLQYGLLECGYVAPVRFGCVTRWLKIAGLLLVAILAIVRLMLHQKSPRPVDAPAAVSNAAHPNGPQAASAAGTSDKPLPPSPIATVEICGHGKVPIDAADPLAAARYLSVLTNKARSRWLSALLDSDDVRARAAGLFLESKLTAGGEVEPIAEQSRDALVQLAVGAGDPAIYAMAVYACETSSNPAPDAACQRITLKNWASLDRDNAVPWLLLAGKAHTDHDSAAENAAFADAAKARKIDGYNYSLYAYSEPDLPTDMTALERWFLAIELVGIESGTGQLQYPGASKHCSAEAVLDAGVRQQCDAVAELLVSKGTTLLDLGMGAAIGSRVGWAKVRVAALAEERDALMQSIMEVTPTDNEDLWTCDGARRGNAHMAQWARLGEIGAAREALERSGQTVSELAKKHRDVMERFMRDAQQTNRASE